MRTLGECILNGRGSTAGLISRDDKGILQLAAVCWVERNRKYFVSTTSDFRLGCNQSRLRYIRTEDTFEREITSVAIPKVCEEYYNVCYKVNRHNRARQDDLQLKNIETTDWAKRANFSIQGICVVDSYLLFKFQLSCDYPKILVSTITTANWLKNLLETHGMELRE